MISRRMKLGLATLSMAAWLIGCPDSGKDAVGPPQVEPDVDHPVEIGIVVSDAFSGAASPSTAIQLADVSFSGDTPTLSDVVFVSLAAGTHPDGATASIRSPRAPGAITATMVQGGLDPVPVPAVAGDTLDLEILDHEGITLARENQTVPVRRRPRIVRTVPPRGKTDVAVNSSIIVVFSEPVSGTTVSPSTVRLVRDALPVAGTVRLLPGNGTIAAFTPNASLGRNTTYRLIVSSTITDLEGETLESDVSLTFTTGESVTGPPQSIRVSPDTVYLRGNVFQLTATVTDAAGNELIDQPVTWESSNPAGLSVSSTGLLTPLAPGNYTVTARVGQLEGRATVYVRGPPASVSILASASSVAVDEAILLSATVRDSAGFTLDVPVTWVSSVPAVARVTSTPVGAMVAIVTGLTTGSATIMASTGAVTGEVVVSVTPRRVIASVTVTPASATMIVGEATRLVATPRDANGDAISNRPISWAIDNPSVATVGSIGQVLAVAVGTARATATSEGVSGSATITVTTLDFASVSAGDLHTCGLTVGGAAYCWGGLLTGEIGNPSQNPRPVAVRGELEYTSISAGAFHTCGLTPDGTAYCWGSGENGALGDGTNITRATPAPVTGPFTFRALTTSYHTCGLTNAGEAYCWGQNTGGQVGDGSTTNRLVPTRVVGGLTFTALAAGSYEHTCGLIVTGEAYCWGRNGQGELGNGSAANSLVPVRVSFPAFVSIMAGGYHTCGLTSNGEAHCWGTALVLGNAAGASSLIPRQVEGSLTFTQLSAGISHTCGLASDGFLYCWGRNDDGQLGDGTTSDRLLPTRVSGGISFSSVSAGGWHTCGRSTDGIVYCWGLNRVGMLGNGSITTNSTVPTKVVGQP
jgi:alpha-tubulin suppressor-like RCC1 family protein